MEIILIALLIANSIAMGHSIAKNEKYWYVNLVGVILITAALFKDYV
jgi:hypothetical protein